MGNEDTDKKQSASSTSFVLFACSIVSILNSNSDDAELATIGYQREYVLAVLIVTAVTTVGLCLNGLCSIQTIISHDNKCIRLIIGFATLMIVLGVLTVLVFLCIAWHHDTSWLIIFYNTFWTSFKGEYPDTISNVWAYKMIECITKVVSASFMICLLILALVGVCFGVPLGLSKCMECTGKKKVKITPA
jgi:hypothetical protein